MIRKNFLYTVLAILILGIGALLYLNQALPWKRPPASWDRLERQLLVNYADITPISADQLLTQQEKNKDSNWVLLDVRSEKAFSISHIKQAVNTPNAKSAIAAATGKESVVLYDETGRDSADTGHEMIRLGYKGTIRRLKGGLFTWAIEKRPLLDGNDKPTVKVYPGKDDHWAKLLPDELQAK